MTLLLGLIAALLLFGLVALVMREQRDDETLAFTLPEHMSSGAIASQPMPFTSASPPASPLVGGSTNIAPQSVTQPTLEAEIERRANIAHAQMAQSGGRPLLNNFLPGNLGLGTTLTYKGQTSEIIGVLSFNFDGTIWQDYFAASATGDFWRFAVEPDRGFRLAAFKPHPISIEPGAPAIAFEGTPYHRTETGIAHFKAIGQTGTFGEGKYHYYDYEDGKGSIIGFERFDGAEWKISIGTRVDPAAVTVNNDLPEDHHNIW